MAHTESGEGERLYRQYLAGDQTAFDGIIRLYKAGLIRFLYHLSGDWHTAEDLSEDCFVELLVHPRRYRFHSSLKTYLYAIARHKAMSHLRRRKNAPLLSLHVLPDEESPDPAESHEQRVCLSSALGSLPREYREVLYLRYSAELSGQEIARVMHKSPKQVYNLSARAKNALKARLQDEDRPCPPFENHGKKEDALDENHRRISRLY